MNLMSYTKLNKILIIIDETNFYHPYFFLDLYKRLKLNKFKISVGLITKVKDANSIEKYLLKNILKLNLIEIIKLGLQKIFYSATKNISSKFNFFFSVKSIIIKFNIDFFEIKYDINNEKYINKINNINPDLIISSCSLIFNKKILSLPKFGCINRHSSLLPSNAGVYSVFHSISKGEKYSGVTIHSMTTKIDQGKILAQKKILNKNNNLSKIYKECFLNSAELILVAIDNLMNNKYLKNKYKRSYNSFPDDNDWVAFRKNKGKFI